MGDGIVGGCDVNFGKVEFVVFLVKGGFECFDVGVDVVYWEEGRFEMFGILCLLFC